MFDLTYVFILHYNEFEVLSGPPPHFELIFLIPFFKTSMNYYVKISRVYLSILYKF